MELPIKESDKILIIAPHADDESIGCGGLMVLYGKKCDILLLTDGRKGYDSRLDTVDEDALVHIRESELQSVSNLCGIRHIIKLRIPDGTIHSHMNDVLGVDITSYDFIFVPNRYERHKDHCIIPDLALKMKKQQRSKAQIIEYEVWSPMPNPVFALDISSVFSQKEHLVSQYQSQIKYKDYVRMTQGLNQYRGVGFNMTYAEVYAPLVNKSFLLRLYNKLPSRVRKLLHKLLRS